MRIRNVVKVVLGLLCASLAFYALFPRFGNDYSCDSSVPTDPAQITALADARSRKAKACSGSQGLCKFEVSQDPDGLLRVSLYFVEANFFEGCIFKEQDIEVFVYTRAGEFVRIEEAPYA
jgi:hypothetical protein